ncbi:aminotransferase class III-fold pyridoxal phosphate-dependent enzyme [Micromonospora fiedleri]|uniref:Aminotransferase class III-fold pyridoxal phosphate-dependent enzyme n=1 Tax=Micromonospora fiedleri TaxID=1157498 RepID=A0ABS1UVB3_9ACTN|nr:MULTISPECIES: aminotransferase class III-fold pyridoxal phosphate-dependent enzyme [Micromonospora]MBL6280322.1 aminotransferase class III-fold pyridoxal phosphate-dependent enzyme [Micromonospora fiedleri]WSK45283.1 aminotransferase class III-fold pyridoxal phosphate-dependent enzyme [Micromonospora maris]
MTTEFPELAEAHLGGLLDQLGLAVPYSRASGDTLYFVDDTGTEVAVDDFVGGYGSLIFGHHHPTLTRLLHDLLERQVPVHAQFSRHPYANDLAAALNRVLHREFGIAEPYRAIFANTGAEAAECALKHAEMERGQRVAALTAEIDTHLDEARAAAAAGAGLPGDAATARLGAFTDVDGLIAAVRQHNAAQLARGPVFLTLENSFHGKLAASVQLTHNPAYRLPFRTLAAPARFVPVDRPGAVAKAVEAERVTVFDLESGDGAVRLVERDLPVIAAFFAEPVQGEGGIRPLDAALAAEIRQAAEAGGFPVVVDEIQTGVGRTGTFFAGAQAGLLGDYVLLAKSIGGGLVKNAVLLVRDSRYQPEFELVHSSTFAKDALSCHIGLAVVDLLEADGGQAYRTVRERGDALRAALDGVAEANADVVAEVRGRGLMQGLEFRDQTDAPAGVVRDFARNGLFGYLVAGRLLRAHRIRVFPTASAPHTLRFQPSLAVTDEAIARLVTGLTDVCALIRANDPTLLTG